MDSNPERGDVTLDHSMKLGRTVHDTEIEGPVFHSRGNLLLGMSASVAASFFTIGLHTRFWDTTRLGSHRLCRIICLPEACAERDRSGEKHHHNR